MSHLFFDGFEKNNKYTPNANLIAASIYATNTNDISVKIYATAIFIVQIIPKYIIDFQCKAVAINAPNQINRQFSVAKKGPPKKNINTNNKIIAYRETLS